MKSLNEYRNLGTTNFIDTEADMRSAYRDEDPAVMAQLDDYCNTEYGRPFLRCSYEEKSTARSVLSSTPEEIEQQDKRDSQIGESKYEEIIDDTLNGIITGSSSDNVHTVDITKEGDYVFLLDNGKAIEIDSGIMPAKEMDKLIQKNRWFR